MNPLPATVLAPLTCTLTGEIMRDPTILVETGLSYEKNAILNWINEHRTDPATGLPLTNLRTVPNPGLRGLTDALRASGQI